MEMFNPPHPGEISARIASNLRLDRRRGKGSAFHGVSLGTLERPQRRFRRPGDLWHARRRAKAIKVTPFPTPGRLNKSPAREVAFRRCR